MTAFDDFAAFIAAYNARMDAGEFAPVDIQSIDFNVDLLQAILWQYNSAENLQGIINAKQGWYNSAYSEFWEAWVRDVFDLRTATTFGLNIWSILLGVRLSVTAGADLTKTAWGFGTNNENFENSNFANSKNTIVTLNESQSRLVLRLRYYQLVSRGTVPEINAFLKLMFGDQGLVYTIDNHDMTYVTYFFTFIPDAQTKFILYNYDLLPRPAGVGVELAFTPVNGWGFGTEHLNFENGNFYN